MKKVFKSRRVIFLITILFTLCVSCISVSAANSVGQGYNVTRLGGSDRYETALKIADQYSSGTLQNVILSTSYDFPDALSGSVYAAQIKAPILLTGLNVSESKRTLDYIENKLDKSGTIYVFGGAGVVSEDILNYLRAKGYTNFVRLGGSDRFDTNTIITNNLKVAKGTPVVLVTAYNFPDALSVSSIAAIKGYPIIISDPSTLSPSASALISTINPSQVYLIGGEGVLSKQVVADVKSILPGITDDNLPRVGGLDRYETSRNICNAFNLNTTNCILTTGETFPDGITGSLLGVKLNSPILLINDENMKKQSTYIYNHSISDIFLLGGTGAISSAIEQNFLQVTTGFDCASARSLAEAQSLKNAGYSFACRYYCTYNPAVPWKNNLTLNEAKNISKAGLKIVAVYQDGGKSDSSYFTYAQGVYDCNIAINNAKAVGQPSNSAIYFAVDYDSNGDYSAIATYFDGVKATMKANGNNQWKIGVYGGYNEVNFIYNRLGPDTYIWQTYAWSSGKLTPNFNVYQYQNDVTISGINVDNNKSNITNGNDIGGFTVPY